MQGRKEMNFCNNNLSWFFSIFTFVTLFAGGSFLFDSNNTLQTELIQFSDLSDADVDVILAVKARMHDAKDQSNTIAFN